MMIACITCGIKRILFSVIAQKEGLNYKTIYNTHKHTHTYTHIQRLMVYEIVTCIHNH